MDFILYPKGIIAENKEESTRLILETAEKRSHSSIVKGKII